MLLSSLCGANNNDNSGNDDDDEEEGRKSKPAAFESAKRSG